VVLVKLLCVVEQGLLRRVAYGLKHGPQFSRWRLWFLPAYGLVTLTHRLDENPKRVALSDAGF
jgi:hypothetical protein